MNGARVYPEDHPQEPVDIHRSRFLQTFIPPVTWLRLIPLARDTVALRVAAASCRWMTLPLPTRPGRPRSKVGERVGRREQRLEAAATLGRTERGCVPPWRHHPQQPVDIRRSRFLQTLSSSTAWRRLIRSVRGGRARTFAAPRSYRALLRDVPVTAVDSQFRVFFRGGPP